ncbi:DASH family cryptochrome [Thalassotalea ponticola]|uniref:DASH family cryptochrome n=1 Tax=Thalassotalea ponticola TaxID=1523392 RepID=UPI0025B32153|nr:DASH family cryptochrome [Thalassotalea ponticola]MDN3653546.1 DASH family cryptochrome [Thalassotalea ponticola]
MANNLFLFTNDLRIEDNLALQRACASSTRLALVYHYNLDHELFDNADCSYIGQHRRRYLFASLANLNRQLGDFSQHLHVLQSRGITALCNFITEHNIDNVYCSTPVASDERNAINSITKYCRVSIHCVWQHTLIAASDLPFAVADLPATFSAFRRSLEKSSLRVDRCLQQPSFPPALVKQDTDQNASFKRWERPTILFDVDGIRAVNQYFKTQQALTYKQTRNALDDSLSSTRFSPLLSLGLVSARQVWWMLKRFEAEHQANESTYWIGFELLWRDYFYWLLALHQNKFFQFCGLTGKRPLTSFNAARFSAFYHAQTAEPLINAAINQLRKTGFISNRARQIVASYFVNELQLDWRYGARYFQMHLIDYDVAANWGNWQYIAGVGCDPRQGRHFNIEKQQQLFDADGSYVKRWGGKAHPHHQTDIVDWPTNN